MDEGTIPRLNRLYTICKAGERGFEVVAENISNRGLKVLLKSFSQQRAGFAAEIKAAIERSGGAISDRRSIRGIIHRGRIDIRGALTIGAQNVENVVLNEALLGEEAAVKIYKGMLDKKLSAEARALVERQYEQVQATHEQLKLLRGRSGTRLVVRLFDSEHDMDLAVRALADAGFDPDDFEIVDVKEVTNVYEGPGHKVSETVVSGAVGGAIWGGIFGAIVGLSVLVFPDVGGMMGSPQRAWAMIALGGTFIGAFFGVILGFLIGQGITEEDAYLYDDSVRHGIKLIKLTIRNERAAEAAHIMHEVNAAARARARLEPA
jgi:uncharacterized protein (TIGR02284 family)